MGFEPEIFGSQSDALITCTQITLKVEKKSLLVFQVVCGMPDYVEPLSFLADLVECCFIC